MKFIKVAQQVSESINELNVRLKSSVSQCQFDIGYDDAASKAHYLQAVLIDQFIYGVESEQLQQALLNKDPEEFIICEDIS